MEPFSIPKSAHQIHWQILKLQQRWKWNRKNHLSILLQVHSNDGSRTALTQYIIWRNDLLEFNANSDDTKKLFSTFIHSMLPSRRPFDLEYFK